MMPPLLTLVFSISLMVGAGLLGRVKSAVRIVMGAFSVARTIGRDRPDAVFVTGGYVSMPVALAAWVRRVPLAMYFVRGWAKCEVGVAVGRRSYDKREAIKKRQQTRDMARELGRKYR